MSYSCSFAFFLQCHDQVWGLFTFNRNVIVFLSSALCAFKLIHIKTRWIDDCIKIHCDTRRDSSFFWGSSSKSSDKYSSWFLFIKAPSKIWDHKICYRHASETISLAPILKIPGFIVALTSVYFILILKVNSIVIRRSGRAHDRGIMGFTILLMWSRPSNGAQKPDYKRE